MAPLRPNWQPSYASGNTQVDNEHQGLFEVLHSVADAIEEGKSAPTIYVLLNYLVRECVAHFANEEALMRASGYPEADRHAEIHRRIAGRITQLLAENAGRGVDELEVVATLFYDAVVLHMLEEDRRFFPYVRPPERCAA